MPNTEIAENEIQLATVLGTDRKSIRRWRKRFGTACPGDRNVAAWRKFMEENLLGTHSPQRQYGERAPAVRAVRAVPVTPAKPNADAPITNWPEQTFRRQTLFEVLDVLHDAYADGLLPAKDYVKIGSGTVELLIKIGRAWKAGIDENAYRSTWLANIAPLLKK